MKIEKKTKELEEILENTNIGNVAKYIAENKEAMYSDYKPFAEYMRSTIKKKGLRQQDVFLNADIPEKYGYKLLSEEKHTKKRDVIIRLCYGAKFSVTETQRALRIYGMSELYVRSERDAVIMIAFNNWVNHIDFVDDLLKEYGYVPLETCGESMDLEE